MALAHLLKDPRLALSETLLKELTRTGLSRPFVQSLTTDFVRRRVRRLVELNPSHADAARRDEITEPATRNIADVIAVELPKVRAAASEIWRRVSSDSQQLPLDAATLRKRGTGRSHASAPLERQRLVHSVVYQAAAVDITLAAGGLDRLHRVCDRRLRIVERMLYDVGRPGPRAWAPAAIEAHPGGPWPDGYERLFEYPRLPQATFLGACRPDGNGRCQAPMQEWGHPRGDVFMHAAIRANPSLGASWVRRDQELDYKPVSGETAVGAVQRLFTPSSDFLGRNLMYCDHTLHALHLESLVFAMTKRGRGTAWLDGEVSSGGDRWLRIHFQFGNPERFLGGSGESRYFEHATVRQADLQVGDHLIVYNHPAYDKATVSGVWRLENALVVQTVPGLKLQGHGSRLLTQGGMWEEMIGLFNKELAHRRADVEGLTRIDAFGPNSLTVRETRYLAPGMQVDIVRDDATETVLAANRTILSMTGRRIRYDGASVSATAAHRLRRARKGEFAGRRDVIEVSLARIVRRVPPSQSQFDGMHQRADWYLCWRDDTAEAIRRDGPRAEFVKRHQLVDYTRETVNGSAATFGWFPLWRPAAKGNAPVSRNGKIAATDELVVTPDHVAGWTWFFDPDPAKRDRVPVVRPKEL